MIRDGSPRKTRSAPRLTEVRADSWLSLLAAARGHDAETAPVSVLVRGHIPTPVSRAAASSGAEAPRDGAPVRLIVQLWDGADLGDGFVPISGARPLEAIQRFVRPDELQAGVELDLLRSGDSAGVYAVAWVESDDELTCWQARPGQGLLAASRVRAGAARVVFGSSVRDLVA